MDPSCRIRGSGQRIEIGRFDLCQLAMLEHHIHYRVFSAQRFQHNRRCREMSADCFAVLVRWLEAQTVEEDIGELLCGVDVERLANRLIDFLLYVCHSAAKILSRSESAGSPARLN